MNMYISYRCIYILIHMYIYIYAYVYMHMYILYVCMHMHIHIYIWLYIYAYAACVYIWLYAHVCICMYTHVQAWCRWREGTNQCSTSCFIHVQLGVCNIVWLGFTILFSLLKRSLYHHRRCQWSWRMGNSSNFIGTKSVSIG